MWFEVLREDVSDNSFRIAVENNGNGEVTACSMRCVGERGIRMTWVELRKDTCV